jgi:trans-aconitate methyltransferase
VSETDSAYPDFWTTRYVAGNIPWDLGKVPASLLSFLADAPGSRSVLVPGCGSGYEVTAFHEAGFDVTALDFSPAAVEQARGILGRLSDAVVLGDFFTHDFQRHTFDLIYERAFLCSLSPARWNAYAKRIVDLLRPHGALAGVFLYGDEPDPPPYPLTDAAALDLFEGEFKLKHSEPITDSLPLFQGKEYWQEWKRI